MRRLELIHLKLFDLDLERGIVTIRQGKGKKDRVILIGDRSVAWIQKYLCEARPTLALQPDDTTLFLSTDEVPIGRDHLTFMARGYIARAKIGKMGACHLFRHTIATLILENGARHPFHPADAGTLETVQPPDLHSGVDPHVEARPRSDPSGTVAETGAAFERRRLRRSQQRSCSQLWPWKPKKKTRREDDGIIAPWPTL